MIHRFGPNPHLVVALRIVVDDRADARAVDDRRPARGDLQQVDQECFGALGREVAVDLHRDRLRRFVGSKGQRAGSGDVVVVGQRGRAVGGGVGDRERLIDGGRQIDGEDRVGRAHVAFEQR